MHSQYSTLKYGYARIVSDGLQLRVLTDSVVMYEQCGFRAGRGCVDQVIAVRQVIEKVIEKYG